MYRYSPEAIEEALKKAVNAWRCKAKKSMIAQLEEVLDRLPVHNILQLRNTISEIEKKNSYILCLQHSKCHNSGTRPAKANLRAYPFRIMIRPLGISILRDVNDSDVLTKFGSLINFEVSRAF